MIISPWHPLCLVMIHPYWRAYKSHDSQQKHRSSHGLVGRCCISTKDLYDNITCNLSGLGIWTCFFSKKISSLEGSVFRFQPLVLGEFKPWLTIKLTFSLLRFKSTSLAFKNGPIHFAVLETWKLRMKSGSNTFAKVLKQICKLGF